MTRTAQKEGTLYGGVDIGGTKIHCVVADSAGTVRGRARTRTKGERGFAAVLERARGCLVEACGAAGVELAALSAVGVGAPSAVTPEGVAVRAPNLGWRNAPLVSAFSALLGKPVQAGNDCDLGTFGEHVYGAGQASRTLVGLFPGTGLGGGIVRQGRIMRGENGLAGELGHMIVVVDGRECGCGHRGCLEAYASKTGMARALAERRRRRKKASTLDPADVRTLRGSVLAAAYRGGDEVAREVVDEAARFLGVGVANVITLLGPDTVVIGGGVFEALGRELLGTVRRAAREHAFPPASFKDTRIVLCALGDDVVALGAVAYVLRDPDGLRAGS